MKPQAAKALVDAYKSGKSVEELAAEFDIDRRTVSAHLHDANIPIRRSIMSDSNIDAAARLYQAGRSARQIAKDFGVNPKTVLSALRKAGVSIRSRHRTRSATSG